MQISDLVNQYQANLGSGTEITGKAKENKGVEQLVSTLSKLQKGQVFEGTVNQVKGNQVILGLSSGQNITARLDNGMSLKVGESVFFQVKSNEDSLIQIKPVSIGVANNPTLLNALSAAGLGVTEDNINMVNTMMKEQMPIDAKSINDMARLVASMPGADTSTVVTMMKHNLPITQEMVNQFENYRANEGQMLKTVEELGKNISTFLSDGEVSPEEGLRFQKELLSILTDTGSETSPKTQAEGLSLLTGERPVVNVRDIIGGASFVNNDSVFTQADALRQMVEGLETESPAMQEASAGANATVEGSTLSADMGAAVEGTALSADMGATAEDTTLSAKDVLHLDGQEILISPENTETMPVRAMLAYDAADFPSHSIAHALRPEENVAFSTAIHQTTEFAAEHPEYFDENGMLKPQAPVSEVLKDLLSYASESPKHMAQLKELTGKGGYEKLLTEAISRSMTIEPSELKEPHKLDDLYQKIESNMSRLASAASHLSGGNENVITQAAAQIHDNLDFISQVNDMYSYIQIPLQLSGQDATGDLYVYRNKKQNKDDNDELSAFLHFDLEHLGSTDISVKMRQKNVNTKFFLGDDAAFELIMNNIHILKENLDNLGYNCTIECENEDKPVDFVSDFLDRGVKTTENISRYSFDVRA